MGHLGLERGDPGLDPFDPALDMRGVLLELGLQVGLARRDLAIGLFADPGHLRLGPVADGDDVVVGGLAQLGGTVGGTGLDRFDVRLRFGLELLQGRGARRFGRALHGAGEVGQELAGLLGGGVRRSCRNAVGNGRMHGGFLGDDGLGGRLVCLGGGLGGLGHGRRIGGRHRGVGGRGFSGRSLVGRGLGDIGRAIGVTGRVFALAGRLVVPCSTGAGSRPGIQSLP